MEKADLTLGLATASSSSSFQEKSGFKKECRSACGMNDMFVLHKALEQERRKIEVFKHELPLCVHLLDKAIEASRRGPHSRYVTSSCPRSSIKNSINFDIEWHQRQDDERKPAQPVKLGLHNLSIQPLRKPAGGRSCSEENNASSQECPKVNNYIIQRKHRRSWSPELHQRFLKALHHLGGSQVATPKQIRELMNVEGLTNDEVKSHLQKFRLHVRKPHIQQGSEQGSDHVVVFGSVWLPNQSSIFSKRG